MELSKVSVFHRELRLRKLKKFAWIHVWLGTWLNSLILKFMPLLLYSSFLVFLSERMQIWLYECFNYKMAYSRDISPSCSPYIEAWFPLYKYFIYDNYICYYVKSKAIIFSTEYKSCQLHHYRLNWVQNGKKEE